MRLIVNALVAFALLSSCKAATQVPGTTAVVENSALTAQKPEPKDGEPSSAFQSDGRKKSPFTQETVLRLNAIIGRSKAAIDRFDAVSPGLTRAVARAKSKPQDSAAAARAREAIASLESMHGEAASAKNDLAAEGVRLDASQVYYDKIIFAGMGLFTQKVEVELADELKALKK